MSHRVDALLLAVEFVNGYGFGSVKRTPALVLSAAERFAEFIGENRQQEWRAIEQALRVHLDDRNLDTVLETARALAAFLRESGA